MFSNSKIVFRKALKADIHELVELRIKQLIDEGYPEINDIREELKKYFSSSLENGSLISWVGSSKEIIVATAGICFYQLPSTFTNPTGRIAYITNMYTDEAYRRRGIASHLRGQLLEEAEALSFTLVRLHASSLGKGVYEKAGFIDTDGYMGMKL